LALKGQNTLEARVTITNQTNLSNPALRLLPFANPPFPQSNKFLGASAKFFTKLWKNCGNHASALTKAPYPLGKWADCTWSNHTYKQLQI